MQNHSMKDRSPAVGEFWRCGSLIGKLRGGHGLDFAVVNTEVSLPGFVRPEQFHNRDPWRIHTADPFDHIDEPLAAARGSVWNWIVRAGEPAMDLHFC